MDELIRRADGGDKAALDELLSSERSRLRNYCRGVLGKHCAMSRQKASDITQCVLLIATKRCEQGRFAKMGSRDEFAAYLKGIAKKEVATLCRKEGGQKQINAPSAVEGAEAKANSSGLAAHRKIRYDRVIQQLDPLEQAIANLLRAGCELKDIPSRLRPKYGARRSAQD